MTDSNVVNDVAETLFQTMTEDDSLVEVIHGECLRRMGINQSQFYLVQYAINWLLIDCQKGFFAEVYELYWDTYHDVHVEIVNKLESFFNPF